MVASDNHWNPDIYHNPDEFDPYRFLRRRQSSEPDHAAHFVATHADHIGFGHGIHACPGRFFAAAEAKVALCHIIMKYDLKLVDEAPPPPLMIGSLTPANPMASISIRRRDAEIEL